MRPRPALECEDPSTALQSCLTPLATEWFRKCATTDIGPALSWAADLQFFAIEGIFTSLAGLTHYIRRSVVSEVNLTASAVAQLSNSHFPKAAQNWNFCSELIVGGYHATGSPGSRAGPAAHCRERSTAAFHFIRLLFTF